MPASGRLLLALVRGLAGRPPLDSPPAALYVQYEGAHLAALVMSKNLCRRHLSASQRAQAIAACSTWRKGGRPKTAAGAQLDKPAAAAELSVEQMAEVAGVYLHVRKGCPGFLRDPISPQNDHQIRILQHLLLIVPRRLLDLCTLLTAQPLILAPFVASALERFS